MSLADELDADQRERQVKANCGTCRFLAGLPDADRREWIAALRATIAGRFRYSGVTIARAMVKRGAKVNDSQISHHRRRQHDA